MKLGVFLLCGIVLLSSLLVSSVFISRSQAAPAWSVQTVESGSYIGAYTSVAVDTYGNPHISYQGTNGGNTTLKYASWNGNSWKFETVDATDYQEGSWTSLVLDSNGNPHISYMEDRMSQLKYAYWTGTSWTIEDVDSQGNAGNYNSLALDSHGNPCIAYHRGGSGLEGSLKYAHWTGSNWKIETVDAGAEGANPLNAGQCCSLALDSADNPHISYISGGGGLNYASWTGSSWDIKTVAAGGSGVYSQLVYGSHLLAIDSRGNAHLVYNVHNWGSSSENATNRPWYARLTGSAWTIEQIDPKAQSCYAESIALDSSGNPYVVYSDMRTDPTNWMHTVNHLEFATRTGSGWSIQEVDSSCADYPSIAVDSGSNPHISYSDKSPNFRMKYAVLAESYQVGFSQAGISGFNGDVLTADSSNLKAANLPITFTWNKGTNHVFSFTSTLSLSQSVRYVWAGTSGLSSAQSGNLSLVKSGNVSAQFQPQNKVSFSVNPALAGVVTPSADLWVGNDGATIHISASPTSDQRFQSWTTNAQSGTINFADSNSNDTTATVKGPGTITANFVSSSATNNPAPVPTSSSASVGTTDVPGIPSNAVEINRTALNPLEQIDQVAAGTTNVYRYSNLVLIIKSAANTELNVTVSPTMNPKVLSIYIEPSQNIGVNLNLMNTQPPNVTPIQNNLNFYAIIEKNSTAELSAHLGLFINQTQITNDIGREINTPRLSWMYWDSALNNWVPVQSHLDQNGYLICDTVHLSLWTIAEVGSTSPSQKPSENGISMSSFLLPLTVVALAVVIIVVFAILRRKRKATN
jgi:hypothetical protein